MSLPLENKLALVTGAAGGIGSAVAKRLAEDGASVLLPCSARRADAEAVAFPASPKAGFINGESLTFDGGWSA